MDKLRWIADIQLCADDRNQASKRLTNHFEYALLTCFTLVL